MTSLHGMDGLSVLEFLVFVSAPAGVSHVNVI